MKWQLVDCGVVDDDSMTGPRTKQIKKRIKFSQFSAWEFGLVLHCCQYGHKCSTKKGRATRCHAECTSACHLIVDIVIAWFTDIRKLFTVIGIPFILRMLIVFKTSAFPHFHIDLFIEPRLFCCWFSIKFYCWNIIHFWCVSIWSVSECAVCVCVSMCAGGWDTFLFLAITFGNNCRLFRFYLN